MVSNVFMAHLCIKTLGITRYWRQFFIAFLNILTPFYDSYYFDNNNLILVYYSNHYSYRRYLFLLLSVLSFFVVIISMHYTFFILLLLRKIGLNHLVELYSI